MKLRRHRTFIKEFKKANLADSQFEKFIQFVNILREGTVLPPESKDHSLSGKDYQDCPGISFRWRYANNLYC